MVAANFNPLFQGWGCHQFSGMQVVFNLPKNPGIANGCATNHDAIYAIPVFIFQRFLWTINISIAKNGNMDAGIIFYFGNQRPVGLTFIHLRAGAAMDGKGFDAYILQSLGYFYNVFALLVPTQPGFYGYRQLGAFYNGARKGDHQVDIL